MQHARPDYNRIQDPAGLIHHDEPVFLIRGQDTIGPQVVRYWARLAATAGVKRSMIDAAQGQAAAMEGWQEAHGAHTPDMPPIDAAPIEPVGEFMTLNRETNALAWTIEGNKLVEFYTDPNPMLFAIFVDGVAIVSVQRDGVVIGEQQNMALGANTFWLALAAMMETNLL